jgi:hypothetical protein
VRENRLAGAGVVPNVQSLPSGGVLLHESHQLPSWLTVNVKRQDVNSTGHRRFLRVVALGAIAIGAIGSLGFMLYVGHRNSSRILLALFALWVLSPFVGLAVAYVFSKRWTDFARSVLYRATLILALGSMAIYGDVAFGMPRANPAFMFLAVPLASWLIVASIAAVGAKSPKLTDEKMPN